ncbi:MAG: CHAP domain-containing protein, partial [Clostridiales bacterium]|nr:CHAP domain-containing protein [Clostridiales bacterium]
MKHSFMQEADKYIKSRQRKRQWYRVVTCLAAVVVFCTVYALILPAITMEQEGQCEIPEHTHDISCYMQVTSIPRRVLTCSKEMLNIHEHTDACYNEKGEPVCGYADFVVHVHDASCYDENGNLWCPLPQIRAHTHNERCFPADTAGTAAEHVHTEECFILTRGALICTETGGGGHTHGDSCYTETASLVCAIPESDAHQHGEGCYATVRELTCTLPETQGHEHTDSCYAWEKTLTCGQAAEPADGETPAEPKPICGGKEIILHKHTEECFDHGTLICGKTQVLEHIHNADCFTTIEEPVDTETLTCELPESEGHQHSALCYGTWILLCTQEEHTHSPICYADPTADLETAEVWEKTIANARLTGEWRQDVLAIAQTQLGYTESRKNFIIDEEDGTKQKGYTRYGAWYGSPYSDWCAIYVSFCLHYAGVPEEKFPMSSGCESWIETLSQEPYNLYHPARFVNADGSEESYVPTVGDLIFFSYDQNGISDHVGIVAELIPATESMPAQIKTIEGNTSNRVRYETYELESPVILGYGLLPEQSFFCGMQGHAHGPECEDSEGQIICGLAEHIHTEACEVPQEEPTTLQFIGPDYTVEVRYGAAALPEGVALLVAEIPADSEEYQHYYEQSVAAMEVAESEETVIFARFFDIQFQLDGQKIEPAAPVSVTITYAEQVETGESVNCQAIHFTEEGPELLAVETANPDEYTTSFTHTQNGFSVVGDMVTAPKTINPTEVGPVALPVDYYVYIDGAWTCVGSTRTGWYGDYSKPGEWTDYNRDYITVAQVESILGEYGFNASSDENPARRIAYQMKNKNDNVLIYSDTNTVEIGGQRVIPLSRDEAHKGFNVYYLPRNTGVLKDKTITDLPTAENAFYTVSVYDPNHIAYAAGEALPETQLVMAGNSVAVTVKAMPENSGAVWQCVNTSWSKVADGTANDDSTVTFNLTSITQQLRITPMATNLGDAIQRKVYYLVFLDGAWTEVGTTTPYYKNENLLKDANGSNYRHFVTSSQAESVLAPFGFRSETYSSTVNGTSVLAHQLGEYDFNKSFYTDGGGEKLSDGSWAIGLGYITNVEIDYSFYYLPTNPENFQGKLPSAYNSTNAYMNGNRFWSVTVRDDGKYVYGNAALEAMKQYAADNGEATVTVQNADGVLWSCVGKNREQLTVESTQNGGYTTFVIRGITQPVEVVATRTNPSFTVQYYGNIVRYATSGSDALKVIDTSGKALPTNGGSMATRSLRLEGTGQKTNQNAGDATELYRVATTTELTKLYTEQVFQYESSPGLAYFNKLKDNESYTLKEIWVLKPGKDAASTNRDDWEIHTYAEDTAFTNEAGQAVGNTILISDGAVIRLVSNTSNGNYHNGTTFYDYNISSGKNADGRWCTGTTGINIESNYGTSRNGQRDWRSGADIFAFGNANCGTGMSGYLFDGSTLNKY